MRPRLDRAGGVDLVRKPALKEEAIHIVRPALRSAKSAIASLLALLGASALACGTAAAENDPADFCRNGQIAVLRVSRIAEGGSRSGFDQAVRDQLAWYRSHGFTKNQLVTANVIVQDSKSKIWAPSATEVLSMHINPPPIAAVKTDAAWNVFVSGFKANAVVESERTICLEQPLN